MRLSSVQLPPLVRGTTGYTVEYLRHPPVDPLEYRLHFSIKSAKNGPRFHCFFVAAHAKSELSTEGHSFIEMKTCSIGNHALYHITIVIGLIDRITSVSYETNVCFLYGDIRRKHIRRRVITHHRVIQSQ